MRLPATLYFAALAVVLCASPACAQTDREAVEGMQQRASLACADYSTDRGNPGIQGVSVDALRVLAKHHFLLCPDRRIKAPIAVAWYPSVGALVWNPTDPAAARVLAQVAAQLTHTEDFPQGLEVWDASGKKLSNMIVPEFHYKQSYDPSGR